MCKSNSKNNEEMQKSHKVLGILIVILSIAYIIIPIDYDGPLIGMIDDFFLFMAAFCFCINQFTSSLHIAAKRKLNIISVTFCAVGFLWLGILAFTPIQQLL